jgi:hypothetical protein
MAPIKLIAVQLPKKYATFKINPDSSFPYSNAPTFRPIQHYMNPVQHHKIQLLLYEPNRKKISTWNRPRRSRGGSKDTDLLFLSVGWGGW